MSVEPGARGGAPVGSDFRVDRQLLVLSALALGIGGVSTVGAAVLLGGIRLFTNLAYLQRLSFDPIHLIGDHLPLWTVSAASSSA